MCFKYLVKTNILPPKLHFAPQTLKSGYAPAFIHSKWQIK